MDGNEKQVLFQEICDIVQSNRAKEVYIYYDVNFEKKLTYSKIWSMYEHFSNYISQLPKSVCVGLYMPNNVCIPALILNFLRYEASFIFLDPIASAGETVEIIRSLNLHQILIYEGSTNLDPFLESNCKLLSTFTFPPKISVYVISESASKPMDTYENIFYVMCTSGTCGRKKYVRVKHACIASNIRSLRREFNITSNDVIYFGTPLTFDPCIVELFLGLTTGATLVCTSTEIRTNPSQLLEYLFKTAQVTVLQMCPSVFLRWPPSEIEWVLRRSTLRLLALGGEPFPENLANFKMGPQVKLFNLYGITEISCWASVCDVNEDVTLGKLLDDTIFEVRSDDGRIVESGEGSLYIGSNKRTCLIDGETEEDLRLPLFRCTGDIVKVENGTYKYLGRSNRVIKRFGHRLNLDALENEIFRYTGLQTKCAWCSDKQRLYSISLAHNTKEKSRIVDKLFVKLLKTLESYRLPDYVDLVDHFPLTNNGKTDFVSLIENYHRPHARASLADTFKRFWCKYLGVNEEDVKSFEHCNFFEMGGTSIQRMMFSNQLRTTGSDFNGPLLDLLLESSLEHSMKILKSHNSNHCSEIARNSSTCFEIVWKFDMKMCIDTPVTMIVDGNNEYVAVGNFANKFVVLNANDGLVISDRWLPNNVENACCLSPCKKHVYVGCFDGNMYCIEVATCDIIWSFGTNDRIKNKGCLTNDGTAIVFGSYDGFIYSLNIVNGHLNWKQFFEEPITANLINDSGNIFVGCIKGTIACVNDTSGKAIWTYKSSSPIFSEASISENLVLFTNVQAFIYCFEKRNGCMRWIYEPEMPSTMYTGCLIHENIVICGLQNGIVQLLKFDEQSCNKVQTVESNLQVSSKPALYKHGDDKYVILTEAEGSVLLYKYQKNELKHVGYINIGGKCFAAPITYKNKLFIGCRDNHLYCLNILT